MSSTTESAWASFDEDPKPRNYNRIVIPVGLLLAAGAVAGPYLYRNLYRTPINSTAGADLIPTGLKKSTPIQTSPTQERNREPLTRIRSFINYLKNRRN
ncbi:hypothetical protein TVAG_526870 [Trichomonas vaginalis G3]|uniref:Transmembrane protein n=1 Tax=Trichomonas vaginalis (strain ATCC PRA-98 / G3) TaxID=412133 RepID=A2I0K5_TRIV3|nr:hypothetical protein TVAGG3_0810970 [Trichomonas vaginalis G3]XP_001582872.2 hypothetical protein TVAGG3_0835830 [Trichomonas vaginalis G3]XP_001583459.2 hypothetical protein TVAGG3_0195930 [Trichomonas vaginalis G3]XP_051084405.1 hypothetical protein TVAGG3_0843190 [Trichomonas vaginalis G3]XP_051085956.1 hypothetical protein TVAGG3_0882600 [Trichomonas vaginalis G3]XP_051085969.1 hypothetical protein TVAGG3_0882860 [Trichomonas vaginalis G3]XP_051107484.1 hypothetical protein TVAGG3_0093|eukprot:XP_001277742.1 hypothetical protein [Trichomonas vaginalis G3]